YEQTVELPEALVTDAAILEGVVGRVEDVTPCAGHDERHLATIAYPCAAFDAQFPALLNLVFGNASLLAGTRLVDVDLPAAVLSQFQGPNHGATGLRALLGVHGRALLATALKPRGRDARELAALAGAFARGGGDIVKDDQNLADDFETFKRRALRCRDAVADANAASGRNCLYLPHASARYDDLERCFEFAAASGIPGLLVCPMIVGLETLRTLAARYPLVVMAHPALTSVAGGTAARGLAPPLLWGTLFRLAGADIAIFPHPGGRFPFTADDGAATAAALRAPLGELAAALPAPAGGMTLERVPELCATYGVDAVHLVGGALFGLDNDIAVATRRFLDAIRAASDERLVPPQPLPAPARGYHLAAGADFNWAGRESSPYKHAEDAAFRGVRRVELVGRFGEPTRTDLRYFEVEPGGYSSFEQHVHGHIVIAGRGRGVLVQGGERRALEVNDVAFIAPLEAHQLRNESDQPFGFFCIVDRRRDRPLPAG
ncbi:MAG: RuBisCO large subunit C-terminal-like domain-containing protein, partial [Gammaproteobacteria bacterium]